MNPLARRHHRLAGPPVGGVGPRRRRSAGAAFVAAGVLAVGVALAACGAGSSTPGVASGSGGSGRGSSGLLAYSSCMRSHGVPDFPDPASTGGIKKSGIINAAHGVSTSQFKAAQKACTHLIPAGESLSGKPVATIPAQDQQDYLNAAACMRSHGITNFPTPSFTGNQVEFPQLEHLVTLNSPQFKQALTVCQKLIPPGLPDSGSNG